MCQQQSKLACLELCGAVARLLLVPELARKSSPFVTHHNKSRAIQAVPPVQVTVLLNWPGFVHLHYAALPAPTLIKSKRRPANTVLLSRTKTQAITPKNRHVRLRPCWPQAAHQQLPLFFKKWQRIWAPKQWVLTAQWFISLGACLHEHSSFLLMHMLRAYSPSEQISLMVIFLWKVNLANSLQ